VRLVSKSLRGINLRPFGERVEVWIDDKAPGLAEYKQGDDSDDGRANSSDGHVLCPNVGIAGNKSVGRSAHRQVESHTTGQARGQDQVQWVNLNGQGLKEIDNRVLMKPNAAHMFLELTISARTGIMMLAMATLELNAVRNTATRMTTSRRTAWGRAFKPIKAVPIILAMPLCLLPSANANPPPNRNTRPHGTLPWMNFQVISEGVGPVGTGPPRLLQ